MFRLSQGWRATLPFMPMALSTLNLLEHRMQSHKLTATSLPIGVVHQMDQVNQIKWFRGHPSPFFISPKHDGVRLVSYQPPPSHKKESKEQKKRGASRSTTVALRETSCYSRSGRAIHGLFWIEEELHLLRMLCGDRSLLLDGELYLHHATSSSDTTAKEVTSSLIQPPYQTSAGGFQTGFLAVSSLVHRLRGNSSVCATEADVLQYVPSLPRYCVFDIASYRPPHCNKEHDTALQSMGVCARNVAAELRRVWCRTLRECGILDVAHLTVVPNITLFSHRLRVLSFLMTLLQYGTASPLLRSHCCPTQPTVRCSARRQQQRKKKDSQRLCGGSFTSPCYVGGTYVGGVPYQLTSSLADTKQRLLPAFLRLGFEGAVIRSPVNVYTMKEKEKGIVAALAAPRQGVPSGTRRQCRVDCQRFFAHRSKRAPAIVLHAYGGGGRQVSCTAETALVTKRYRGATEQSVREEEEEEEELSLAYHASEQARCSQLRSESAVKVLALQDREYPILCPLLKKQSTNPLTRPLVTVPLSVVRSHGMYVNMTNSDETRATGKSGVKGRAKRNTKGSLESAVGSKAKEQEEVAFYGLRCLAENGIAFNVSIPRMSLVKQRALLDHLLNAGRPPSQRNKRNPPKKSLVGLYATVKYSTLTEHGLPRFGTVKAIRGDSPSGPSPHPFLVITTGLISHPATMSNNRFAAPVSLGVSKASPLLSAKYQQWFRSRIVNAAACLIASQPVDPLLALHTNFYIESLILSVYPSKEEVAAEEANCHETHESEPDPDPAPTVLVERLWVRQFLQPYGLKAVALFSAAPPSHQRDANVLYILHLLSLQGSMSPEALRDVSTQWLSDTSIIGISQYVASPEEAPGSTVLLFLLAVVEMQTIAVLPEMFSARMCLVMKLICLKLMWKLQLLGEEPVVDFSSASSCGKEEAVISPEEVMVSVEETPQSFASSSATTPPPPELLIASSVHLTNAQIRDTGRFLTAELHRVFMSTGDSFEEDAPQVKATNSPKQQSEPTSKLPSTNCTHPSSVSGAVSPRSDSPLCSTIQSYLALLFPRDKQTVMISRTSFVTLLKYVSALSVALTSMVPNMVALAAARSHDKSLAAELQKLLASTASELHAALSSSLSASNTVSRDAGAASFLPFVWRKYASELVRVFEPLLRQAEERRLTSSLELLRTAPGDVAAAVAAATRNENVSRAVMSWEIISAWMVAVVEIILGG